MIYEVDKHMSDNLDLQKIRVVVDRVHHPNPHALLPSSIYVFCMAVYICIGPTHEEEKCIYYIVLLHHGSIYLLFETDNVLAI